MLLLFCGFQIAQHWYVSMFVIATYQRMSTSTAYFREKGQIQEAGIRSAYDKFLPSMQKVTLIASGHVIPMCGGNSEAVRGYSGNGSPCAGINQLSDNYQVGEFVVKKRLLISISIFLDLESSPLLCRTRRLSRVFTVKGS